MALRILKDLIAENYMVFYTIETNHAVFKYFFKFTWFNLFLPIVRICIVFNCKIVLKLAWSWACIWYHTLRCTCNGVALCRSSPHRPSATCWWPIFSIVMKGLCLLLLQPWGDHSQVAHAGMFILHAWTVLQGVMHIIFCGCYTWNSGISSEPEIAFHRGSEALLHLGRGAIYISCMSD